MTGGVRKYLVGSVVLAALIAVAGCSHYLFAEREPWRREAEVACLNSGVVESVPGRVRISSIEGPGACGMDYPLRVSAVGENAPISATLSSRPMSYDDAPLRPPSSIPNGDMPQQWPGVQSSPLPPPQGGASPYGQPPLWPTAIRSAAIRPALRTASRPYGQPPYGAAAIRHAAIRFATIRCGAQPGPPMSLAPPPVPSPPLGPPAPMVTASVGPVEVKPPATLACPIVSALDKWISEAVQPAALKWFRQPVVEIKQISAYSCRGMNGNPNAHISEHAFGNALDVAEFDLADGHKVSVQYGWHGTPEEQGFLHDVQVGRVPGIHHRAGARRQRLSLQSHPRGSDAAHQPPLHLRARRHSGRSRRRPRAGAICRPAPLSRRHRLDQSQAVAAIADQGARTTTIACPAAEPGDD